MPLQPPLPGGSEGDIPRHRGLEDPLTPANDNIDPAPNARSVLLHVLGKEARQSGTEAHTRLLTGLGYARATHPSAMDATLAIAGADVVAAARAILREGKDLTTAGRALKPYKTDQQARAWATGKMECALSMLEWHPERIGQKQLLARWSAWAADQRAIKAAKAAVPLR